VRRNSQTASSERKKERESENENEKTRGNEVPEKNSRRKRKK
jgi:hypothetical protein